MDIVVGLVYHLMAPISENRPQASSPYEVIAQYGIQYRILSISRPCLKTSCYIYVMKYGMSLCSPYCTIAPYGLPIIKIDDC